MVNAGHKVRVRFTAALDDGMKLDLGMDERDETEFVLGAGEATYQVERLAASMDVGETETWSTPAVRVFGPSMVGHSIDYELTLIADLGQALSAMDEELVGHEHGCSCGCGRLRHSLAHA